MSTVVTGKHPIAISISPSGKHAYVANQNGNSVSQYSVAENGSLIPMTTAFVESLVTPVSIAVSDCGKYAYVSNISSNNISQYAIDEQGGFNAIPVNKWGDSAVDAEVSPRCVMIIGMGSNAAG
jgi:DNA-binding beta-propeller fold protein YncE